MFTYYRIIKKYNPYSFYKTYKKLKADSLKEAKKYIVPIYRDKKGNIISRNNELDAFRHTYSSAYITYEFSNVTSWLGGLFAELGGEDNTESEHLMDYYNNRVGRAIGRSAKRRGISLDNLGSEVYQAYVRGDLVLSPPLSRNELPEENSFFDPKTFKKPIEDLGSQIESLGGQIKDSFDGIKNQFNNLDDRIFFLFDSSRPKEEQAVEFRDHLQNMFMPEIERTIKDTFAEFFAAQSNAKYTGRITNPSHSQQMDGLMRFLRRGYRNL